MLKAAKDMLHTIVMRVEYILENIPEARDNDKKLLWVYWQHFDGMGDYLTFENFKTLTSAETITRARREIQEAGKYPASDKVQGKRGEREHAFRTKFGRHVLEETPFI